MVDSARVRKSMSAPLLGRRDKVQIRPILGDATCATSDRRTIAIVGGGFSGAAVAFHLASANRDARIVIFEPRALLGAGLAYSDADPCHRINVPAAAMSLLPDDDAHFTRWLQASGALERDPAALVGQAAFPGRLVFGQYMDSMLRPFVRRRQIVHVRDTVVGIQRGERGWLLRTARGEAAAADYLVIATTHPEPKIPARLKQFAGDPRLVHDALGKGALDSVALRDRVLIVGSGLTAADIVATLDARGHEGPITMISRRGLRSQGHSPQPSAPEGEFMESPARTATRLVTEIRRAVREAGAQGRSWHAVLDNVRLQGAAIWSALEPDARRRIVRHVRPFWDAHRFRVAPQIETVLERKLADGSLEMRKAGLGPVERVEDEFVVALTDRRRGTTRVCSFERVIVATGPAHGDILRTQRYLNELAEAGAVALDATGLGLKTTRDGRAVGASGGADPTIFVAGPLARGTFGELMGMPNVSIYARFIARELDAALACADGPAASRQASPTIIQPTLQPTPV